MSARTAVVVISAALLVPGAAASGAQPGAALLEPAPLSSAAPAWGPVVKLGTNPLGAALAVDKNGTVTAVWEAVTRPRSIVVRQHRPGHAWSQAHTVGHGFEPALTVDGHGTVTVVWRGVRRGFSDGVLAARHPAGGRWSAPIRISHDVKIAGYPTDGDDVVGASGISVAVGPVAGVVATWEWGSDNRPFPSRIQAAVLPPGGTGRHRSRSPRPTTATARPSASAATAPPSSSTRPRWRATPAGRSRSGSGRRTAAGRLPKRSRRSPPHGACSSR